jgi:N-acetylglucosamine kinase-like BadF-type ATPase
MVKALAGIDVGGTKAAVRIEDVSRSAVLVDTVVPSEDWDAEPVESGVAWIRRALAATVPGDVELVGLGVGAQGLDNAEVMSAFSTLLSTPTMPAVAVNDAALLGPAAGLDRCIAVIAGTGAIGVAWSDADDLLIAGGWGHVIGDDAGAAGLVRLATVAALSRHDDGLDDDGLLSALLSSFGVADAERLARAVNDLPTTDNWAPHAPAVFAAAERGSAAARTVLDDGSRHLARLVDQLVARGAASTEVIVAGSVIVSQPSWFDRTATLIRREHPGLSVSVLDVAPVVGAVELAARAAAARTAV